MLLSSLTLPFGTQIFNANLCFVFVPRYLLYYREAILPALRLRSRVPRLYLSGVGFAG